MRLIGVDVGGTFTDIVLADTESGRSLVHKVPTIPEDPSCGVIVGIVEWRERLPSRLPTRSTIVDRGS